MRVSRKKCAENRERVLEAAAKLFCEEGFDDITLVDVMKAAGLTHGGFYGHFSSKDDLEIEATALALTKVATRWQRLVDRDAGDPLAGLVDHYLSSQDWAQRCKRCALATLVADVARQGKRVRTAFAAGLEPVIDVLANTVTDRCPNARLRKALSIMSELIGALILARAVRESALSEQVIDAALSSLSHAGGHPEAAEGLPACGWAAGYKPSCR